MLDSPKRSLLTAVGTEAAEIDSDFIAGDIQDFCRTTPNLFKHFGLVNTILIPIPFE